MQASTQMVNTYPTVTQTSILPRKNDVTELFTGYSSYFVAIIQMKRQQQTADPSAELFD